MARLRLAYVEYRRCHNPGCKAIGQGSDCAHCGARYQAATERIAKPQLIVDDAEPPRFARQERWRCAAPGCKELFAPPDLAGVITLARRCECGAERLSRDRVAAIIAAAPSVLLQARRLVQALQAHPPCACCGQPVPPVVWCPHCWTRRMAHGAWRAADAAHLGPCAHRRGDGQL